VENVNGKGIFMGYKRKKKVFDVYNYLFSIIAKIYFFNFL